MSCAHPIRHLLVKGHNMQVPLDITFRNSEPSEAIRSEVEKQAKRLEKFNDRITSCHVTVIAPTMKRRHGDLFKIDICVAMLQHKDILVSKLTAMRPNTSTSSSRSRMHSRRPSVEDAAREMRG
jgi:ribosome-associated translation inhibitor RaiA